MNKAENWKGKKSEKRQKKRGNKTPVEFLQIQLFSCVPPSDIWRWPPDSFRFLWDLSFTYVLAVVPIARPVPRPQMLNLGFRKCDQAEE